eukprot:TRINITY_DN11109_c0_g1_i1.p1 TRINITY_DN11109_c0_g1~~TRINITY_DN11109_c0_g1_i1.p1  ORF type:complete len:490 (-),score=83.49 TRINITY_DN11109_c0_g1_i1:18-1487(-)
MYQSLNDYGLHDSVALLNSFTEDTPKTSLETAIAYYHTKDYQQAVDILEILLENISNNSSDDHQYEWEIRRYAGLCLLAENLHVKAIQMMMPIPLTEMPISLLSKIGSITLKLETKKRKAQPYFFEIIRRQPKAIEAYLGLIDSGSTISEIQQYLSPDLQQHEWVVKYLEAYSFSSSRNYIRALAIYTQLQSNNPSNLFILEQISINFFRIGYIDQAIESFSKIRRFNKKNRSSMHLYAYLLLQKGKVAELTRLCRDMLEHNPNAYQTWSIVAMYYDAIHAKENSMMYIERAMNLNPYDYVIHIYRAMLYSSMNQYHIAIPSLKIARRVGKEILTYEIMIQIYLNMNEIDTAHRLAVECNKLHSNNPRALTLLGNVHSCVPDKQETAMNTFKKILKVHPNCIEASIAFVKFLIKLEKLINAKQILEEAMANHVDERLYILLGEVHLLENNNDAASIAFAEAIRINPLVEEELNENAELPDSPESSDDVW